MNKLYSWIIKQRIKNFGNALLLVFISLVAANAQQIIAIQDFETAPATPTLFFSTTSGTMGYSTTTGTFLGARSWSSGGKNSSTTTVNVFENQSIENFKDAFVEFSVGAKDLNLDDELIASISVDGGTTWSEEVLISGSSPNNGAGGDSWSITADNSSNIKEVTYQGTNPRFTYRGVQGAADNPSIIRIHIPSDFTSVRVRLQATSNRNGEFWYVDNVSVKGTRILTTLAQLTEGIAASPLRAGATNQAILGFSLSANFATTLQNLTISNSSTPAGKFTNLRLFTSTDNSFTTTLDNTNTGATVSVSGNNFVISNLNTTLGATPINYFIVATVESNVSASTEAIQPSLTSSNVVVNRGFVSSTTVNGTNYTFAEATTPVIVVSTNNLGNLGATNFGTPTPAKSFTVSGAALTDNITINAPTNFEISLSESSGFGSAVTINRSGSNVPNTTVYVRYNPATNNSGLFTGDVVASSLGATPQNVNVSGSTLVAKPTAQTVIPSFGSTNTFNSIEVNIERGNGNKLLLVAKYNSPVDVNPQDGINYTGNTSLGQGSHLGNNNYVVFAGTTSSPTTITVNDIAPNQAVHFAAFEYNENTLTPEGTQSYLLNPGRANSVPKSSYEWNASSGLWNTSGNWTPARNTKSIDDILVFNGAKTPTATVQGIPDEILGQLHLIGNITATFQLPNNSSKTLTLNRTLSGDDFTIAAGSTLIVEGASNQTLTVSLSSSNTGVISGTLEFTGTGNNTTSHRISANSPGALAFKAGSAFVQAGNTSAMPFGTAAEPRTNVVFEPGSTYRVSNTTAPSLAGNKYANLEIANATFNHSSIDASNLEVGNIILTTAENFGLNLGGIVNIKGDIRALSGTTLNFSPASSTTLNFNGTTPQLINGEGTLTFNANTNVFIRGNSTVTLQRNIAHFNGSLTVDAGGTLDLASFQIARSVAGTGLVTVDGTVKTANPAGLSGGSSTAMHSSMGTPTLGSNSVVEYASASTQTVTPRLGYRTIILSGGGIKQLTDTLYIPVELRFVSGKLALGAHSLTVAGTISGENTSNYVLAEGTGYLRRPITALNTMIRFPIGTSEGYTPLEFTLNRADFSFTGYHLDANVAINSQGHPQLKGADATSTIFLKRLWRLIPVAPEGTTNGFKSTTNDFAYDISVNYLQGDINFGGKEEGQITLGKYDFADENNATGNWRAGGGFINTGTNTMWATNVSSFSSFTGAELALYDAISSLPIDLLFFKARPVNELVELTWATSSETNNKLFTVERSTDGKNYVPILVKAGAGNSSSRNEYHAVDNQPITGVSFYRLKHTDFDENHSYSATVKVNFGLSKDFDLVAYPNPSNGHSLSLIISGMKNQHVILKVTDLLGKVAYTETITPTEDNQELYIDFASQLSTGTYSLVLKSNNKIITKKLVVH